MIGLAILGAVSGGTIILVLIAAIVVGWKLGPTNTPNYPQHDRSDGFGGEGE